MPSIRSTLISLAVAFTVGLTVGFMSGGKRVHAIAPIALLAPDSPQPSTPMVDKTFESKVQPFLKQYCTTCHNGVKQSAGLDLEPFTTEALAKKDRDTWEKIREQLQSKAMPPKSKPQPAQADRDFIATYADKITKIDCSLAKDPGRVTIRRLNRAEYNNTIRDLVGIDFHPADDFPSDDVGYGFDNIGDVLSLPPILLEKYMTAAEQVVNRAIVKPEVVVSSKQIFRPQNLIASNREFKDKDNKRIYLHSNGSAFIQFTFPADGEYLIRVRSYGDQAGAELPKLVVKVADQNVKSFDIAAKEDKPETIEVKYKAKEGAVRVAAAFTNDFMDDKATDPKKKDRNLSVLFIEIEGPLQNVTKPLPESHRKIFIADPMTGPDVAARKILGEFARKAWRRPVTTSEVDRLMKLVQLAKTNGETFEDQIKLALRAVLVSPNFLFRVERDQPGAAIYSVNEFEFASRLSYFLWSSMPDDELFGLAQQGKLRQKPVLEAQVRRMLKDPKSKALVDNFASQWLNLRLLQTVTPDKKMYPNFDQPLRVAMVRETEMFFDHIIRNDRSVLEFLDADYTFVNERLASHYGIPNVRGPDFREVKLTDSRRGGVITMASVLTLTSNPTRTSPVKRGKWVLDNILGTPPPPPPPDAGELKEEDPQALTGGLRQRMEKHRSNAVCASCHQRMDPLGFGLENFDGIGAWRTDEGKFKIDSSGTLPDGASFAGPPELRKVLIGKADQFRHCLSEKLLTYAMGRGLEAYDKCAIDEITAKLKQNQDRFLHLVLAIVESDPFQKRRNPTKE